jgi:hypothetical protein
VSKCFERICRNCKSQFKSNTPTRLYCPTCKPLTIKDRNQKRYQKSKDYYKLKAIEFRLKNPLKRKAYEKKYRDKNPLLSRKWQVKRFLYIFESKGNKCERCGFDNLSAFQIHHKNGQKDKPRDWMNKNYDLNRLELLCANCHSIEHYSGRFNL